MTSLDFSTQRSPQYADFYFVYVCKPSINPNLLLQTS